MNETDKKIEDALLKLLAEGGVSNLNVRKICRTAGIHHTTFYKHYDDVMDLLNKVTESKKQDLVLLFHGVMARPESEEQLRSEVITILDYVYSNREFYKVYFNELQLRLIDDGIEYTCSKTSIIGQDNIYRISFYLAGFIQVIREWVLRDCIESKDEIAQLISQEMFNGIRRAVEESE